MEPIDLDAIEDSVKVMIHWAKKSDMDISDGPYPTMLDLISVVRKQREALEKSCICWASKDDAELLMKAGHNVTYCHACTALALTAKAKEDGNAG